MSTLTQEEIGQLSEISNIGAGNAATALSHMIGKKIQMSTPESYVGKLEEVQNILGKNDDRVFSVLLKMYGDIDGWMAMIFQPESALNIAEMLTKKKRKDITEFEEIDTSALREVGNILLGASITAFGRFLDINISHSIPNATIDMLGAIMDSVMVEASKDYEKTLAFKINLKVVDNGVSGDLFYFFDPVSSTKILESMNKKLGSNN